MQYFEETIKLDEAIDRLVEAIECSECMQRYKEAKRDMEGSSRVVRYREDFLSAKKSFEAVASYGEYALQYQERKKEAYRLKRQLDMLEEVSYFRQCEMDLQSMLDEVATGIAHSVGDEIKVDSGNPFFTMEKRCGGNCHE